MKIALYRGPATLRLHKFAHALICNFTGSEFSHVELVLDDGTCWTSSSRDGGVRRKRIDTSSGKWEVVEIGGDEADAQRWFVAHEGQRYDWIGVFRFVLPFLPNRRTCWFCSEAVAAALGLPAPQTWTPQDLFEHFAEARRDEVRA